jgi:UDP-N-acetylglucosamine 4,6-dehydratase
MSVEEAVDIILRALQAPPGSIIVPLAQAMTMADVATAAVGEVEFEAVGERPGEKLHENLIHYQESVRVIHHSSHLELLPTGQSPPESSEPFTLSSQNPHFWMSPEVMRQHIKSAKEV